MKINYFCPLSMEFPNEEMLAKLNRNWLWLWYRRNATIKGGYHTERNHTAQWLPGWKVIKLLVSAKRKARVSNVSGEQLSIRSRRGDIRIRKRFVIFRRAGMHFSSFCFPNSTLFLIPLSASLWHPLPKKKILQETHIYAVENGRWSFSSLLSYNPRSALQCRVYNVDSTYYVVHQTKVRTHLSKASPSLSLLS